METASIFPFPWSRLEASRGRVAHPLPCRGARPFVRWAHIRGWVRATTTAAPGIARAARRRGSGARRPWVSRGGVRSPHDRPPCARPPRCRVPPASSSARRSGTACSRVAIASRSAAAAWAGSKAMRWWATCNVCSAVCSCTSGSHADAAAGQPASGTGGGPSTAVARLRLMASPMACRMPGHDIRLCRTLRTSAQRLPHAGTTRPQQPGHLARGETTGTDGHAWSPLPRVPRRWSRLEGGDRPGGTLGDKGRM